MSTFDHCRHPSAAIWRPGNANETATDETPRERGAAYLRAPDVVGAVAHRLRISCCCCCCGGYGHYTAVTGALTKLFQYHREKSLGYHSRNNCCTTLHAGWRGPVSHARRLTPTDAAASRLKIFPTARRCQIEATMEPIQFDKRVQVSAVIYVTRSSR